MQALDDFVDRHRVELEALANETARLGMNGDRASELLAIAEKHLHHRATAAERFEREASLVQSSLRNSIVDQAQAQQVLLCMAPGHYCPVISVVSENLVFLFHVSGYFDVFITP